MEQNPTQNCLETPQQLANRVGVPVASIRQLIRSGQLDHLFLSPGRRNPKVPVGAWERYLENFTVRASPQTKRINLGGPS
ncbi:MAG: hypothetical protein ABJP66_07675 [Hyphomicrobiales bacterium]